MLTNYKYNPHDELWDNAAKFVTQRAQRLLKLSGMTMPPFLPECLAPLQGIKSIIPEDLGKLSGLLLPLRDGFKIKINATHSPERQNFSCAHEIGHTFFLDKDGQALRERLKRGAGEKVAKSWEEDLCDVVASELLMPSQIYTKYAARYNFGIDSLIALSRAFSTSITPTALRLCDLNPRRCFLIYWVRDNFQELNDVKLRAKWLTWSRMHLSSSTGRFLFNPKLSVRFSSLLKAYKSDITTYSRERARVNNFIGDCQIWSQGFGSGSDRFVLSLLFPEQSDS